MTFVAGFYSFGIELADSDRERYESLRFKIPRHPDEDLTYLCSRAIAYIFTYEEGLLFSPGLFALERPALELKDCTGTVLSAADVGDFDVSKFKKLARLFPPAQLDHFCFADEQSEDLGDQLSLENLKWIRKIRLHLIAPEFIQRLSETIASSNRWQVTISGSMIYINTEKESLEGVVESLNADGLFQSALQRKKNLPDRNSSI